MEVAHIHVSGTQAHPGRVQPITAGIVGAVVRMSYTDDPWDGLIRNVVFRHEGKSVGILNAGKTVQLPAELVAEPSREPVFVGVCGVDANDTVLIPTLWAKIGPVSPSPSLSGEPAADPSLPIWAQLQQANARIERKADNAKSAADNATTAANAANAAAQAAQNTANQGVQAAGAAAQAAQTADGKAQAAAAAASKAQETADGAIQAPAVAEVGQTIRVSRVNNDGKPIEWEAVDFPEGGGTQPDWNQNDPTKADYVKNRPFWADDPVETVLFDGTIVTVDGWTNDDLPFVVTEYMEYTVTFNGAVYESVGVKYKGFVYVGNPAIWIGDLSLDNGLPFAIGEGYDGEHSVVGVTICGDSHTLKIVEKTRKTHKLSGRYFDFPNPVRAVGYNYETDEMIVLRELERIDVVPKEMYNEMRRDDSIVLIDDGLHLPPENFAFITSIEEYLDVSNLSKGETVSMRLDSTSRVHYPSLCKGANDFNSIFVVRLDDHQGGSTVLLNGALGANTLTPSGKLCLVQVLGHGDYAILQATVVAVFPTD